MLIAFVKILAVGVGWGGVGEASHHPAFIGNCPIISVLVLSTYVVDELSLLLV